MTCLRSQRSPPPASLAQVPPASCSHEANRRWARGSQEAAEAARRQPADSQAAKGRRIQPEGSAERQRPAARKQRGGSKGAVWQPAASLVAASKGSRGSKEALEGKAARSKPGGRQWKHQRGARRQQRSRQEEAARRQPVEAVEVDVRQPGGSKEPARKAAKSLKLRIAELLKQSQAIAPKSSIQRYCSKDPYK